MSETIKECIMTLESIEGYISHEISKGATANTRRRCLCALRALFDYVAEDSVLSKDILMSWRRDMENKGYSSATILNYVKIINRYLDFSGFSHLRFNRGRAKDIAGMTFGYLKAILPTDKRDRGDIVWICECKCGKIVELPATRLLTGNTLSCGCIHKEQFYRINRYIDNTSLRQALDDSVESTRSMSGYVGVTRKRDKWQAYITYKGRHYSLGAYSDVQDAVKARMRAKELVIADAEGLIDFYEELHKADTAIPHKSTLTPRAFATYPVRKNEQLSSAAKRQDNRSGCTGVSKKRNLWEAKIAYNGVRYVLGTFEELNEAVAARKRAEKDLNNNPALFEEEYQRKYNHYIYQAKKEID